MRDGELLRVRFAFGMLGVVPVFLAGWLGWLQVAQAGELPRVDKQPLRLVRETADNQAQRQEAVPAPRGTIVDRHGNLLAVDCESYEVRARIGVPAKARADVAAFRSWLARLADDLALALVDPGLADRADARDRHAARLARTLQREFRTDELPATGKLPEGHRTWADVLVASEVEVLSVVQALRRLDEDDKRYGTVALHFLRSFRRVYPERELTYGFVGHVETKWVKDDKGDNVLEARGVGGLESASALVPDEATARRFLKDGRGRPYFLAPLAEAPVPNVLHSTLDIDLQRIAMRELTAQAERGAREGAQKIPKWGALVLVEIETGDVLAAASWHRDAKNPQAASFTPSQCLFEPGSIVKPLVLAYAHEAGVLDWNHVFDCTPGGSEYRERIAKLGRSRPVKDDHDCAELNAHGILVNSSNIGAVYCGLLLEREQWQDYMDFYGVGAPLGINLPHSRGGVHRESFDPARSLRAFRANSAISFSFGYEHTVTPMHVARAYLRLFRGGGAELRVCRGVEIDGAWHAEEPPTGRRPGFRPEVVDAVRAAMVDVVSPDPKATGTYLHAQMLKELGIDLHGVIAGKTGTAATRIGIPGRGLVEARNASFVGFTPVESPRWLVVCVMQKDNSASFYGGSYAAPPAVRLLLQCQQLEQRRLLHQDSPSGSNGQVRDGSASPGDSGWGPGASGTTAAGR